PNLQEYLEGTNPLVKDNDVFNVPRFFAMQQYRDFLGREGDETGIQFWTGQMAPPPGSLRPSVSRAYVVQTFFTSAEFQGAGAPVVRLYFAYFLRIPDYDGLNFWMAQFRSGTSLQAISNNFAASPEFNNRYGSLTNSQFVTLVYNNVLGRAPDSGGPA